jgi:SAM-dependent methyltransferase
MLKYALYEEAVQEPDMHTDLLALMHADLTGKRAHILREDFAGTHLLSSWWVKRDPKNRAICLDLDPEPLAYGALRDEKQLTPAQRKRLDIRLENVMKVTSPKADMAIACNFSFFIFKERKTLVQYFKAVRQSLKPGGIFVIELSGGPGMIEEDKETRTVWGETYNAGRKLVRMPKKFVYTWDQKKYNPITHEGLYAIHFKLPDGRKIMDAFVYDWRVWTIRELRDAMDDAGFKSTHCYWDVDRHRRKKDVPLGQTDYARTEFGENYFSWIAQVAGVR